MLKQARGCMQRRDGGHYWLTEEVLAGNKFRLGILWGYVPFGHSRSDSSPEIGNQMNLSDNEIIN